MIGESLLHYRVEKRLGKGGMGEVFLALDTKLQRHVALKVLPPELANQPRRWERFLREVRAVAALNHPNIVTLFAVEEAGGRHFFTMEVVEGETLDRRIPSGGVGMERFFTLAVPLVDAIAAAHAKGITHRDLKPENVMVSRDGRLKVLDFGMAKPGEDIAASWGTIGDSLTEEGYVVGTARYMAPEQARGEAIDHRADIFSVGIILYELATGSYPFQGRSAAEVISSILRDAPPMPNLLVRAVPARLASIIYRCLEKRPDLRYQSAAELRDDLEAQRPLGLSGELPVELERTWAEPRPPVQVIERRSTSATTSKAPGGPSLAVLPLADLSGQPDYFAEGLTGELITKLGRIGSLRVISRQSVMRYRDSTKLLPEIAREIGVDHIIEGSVLRAGDRVRISLQLVRADPEEQLWAETYDRDLRDVFAVHSEVARAVAEEIEVKLSSQEELRLATEEPVSAEVVEAYLKGRYFLNKRTQESLRQAMASFEEAIELAPGHAASYAGLAETLALLSQRVPDPAIVARARDAARKALELDADLAEAHTALGFVTFYNDWDWATAERELQRALELAPNQVATHLWYWGVLLATGRHREAWREIRRASELDPLAPVVLNSRALHHLVVGEDARAIERSRKALELEPGFPPAFLCLWRAQHHQGNDDAAVAALGQALTCFGRSELVPELERVHREEGYARAAAATADALEASGVAPLPLEVAAWLYLDGGRNDDAMSVVEEAFAQRSPLVLWLGVHPDWSPLRGERRFAEIVRAAGLR